MRFPRLFPGGPFVLGERIAFPNPELADADGLLAVGGDLSPERLEAAYRAGIFPWFSEGEPVLWWCPPVRACLHPREAHISRRLARTLRQQRFHLRVDHAFSEVVRACAQTPRSGQAGTWITADMQTAYGEMHRRGHAHSIEAWREGRLVGGLYGLSFGHAFFGESMFSLETDASKVCFVRLAQALDYAGYVLFDAQVQNPHTTSLGARGMPRAAFLGRLEQALQFPDGWGKVQQALEAQ